MFTLNMPIPKQKIVLKDRKPQRIEVETLETFKTYLHFSLHSRSAASHSRSWFSDSIKNLAHLLYKCYDTYHIWHMRFLTHRSGTHSIYHWTYNGQNIHRDACCWAFSQLPKTCFGSQNLCDAVPLRSVSDLYVAFIKCILRRFCDSGGFSKETFMGNHVENYPCSNFSSLRIL